nr:MAG TPA: LexA-like protein [Caudoviricetes sp.]
MRKSVNVENVNVLCVNPTMDNSPEEITAAVQRLADRAGLNMSQFAKRLGYKAASSVQRYFDPNLYKGGYLNPEFVSKLLANLVGMGNPPITADDIKPLAGPIFADQSAIESKPTGFIPTIIPGRDLVGDKNFPVFAAARGGAEGHQIVTFEPIDYVKRPQFLENVKDAYALYIMGDSMIPAFEQGDMALVHPHLPPARDKNVVLYHVPPFTEAEAEAMVKRLVGFDDRDWNLRQYQPAKDFTVTRSDWRYCHRIVGKYEAR